MVPKELFAAMLYFKCPFRCGLEVQLLKNLIKLVVPIGY